MNNKIGNTVQQKLTQLEDWFSQREGSIVAFSGGIDSSLVLYLARKFQGREKAIGVISNSESLKTSDYELAQAFCRDFDIQLEVIKTNELEDERYNQNPVNRCFFCKEHLFHDLSALTDQYPGFDVLSGTNFDDLGDYRPGIDAARQFSVLSPMVDCKVSKGELREMARYFGLPNWDKPASPCLSSRIPYNQSVTREKLRQIEQAEEILNGYGFSDVRVRHYGDYGKIEVKKEDLVRLQPVSDEISEKIISLGFKSCVIDEEGLVSGKLNRVIQSK
ncbi:ATP-dependent sacrificial sulfur transferase LarE [Roseimarinus sediminis]|uniref:ATP-dependent sacrificial sulfur transferase LarE n=1 Tax=Roseimarinus sediminis TaxID=1610899 RepID=UPI003D252734